ncbi:hypothetical protein A9Q91_04425 [Candidatus Gracilibacteria bacterium 28_42_T64]|nr:hypothetical protein A9Q91_04425 [Candidatus Gracilibacteria bacterium 28_42_T64]
MFKKVLCLLFLSLFIVSCGDDALETTEVSTKGLTQMPLSDFSISIPASWGVIEDVERILPKPSDGNIELAVTSKEIKAGFSNNMLILSDTLNTFTTSKEFSMLNNVGASKDYLEYTKLDSKEIIFTDEEVSILYIFEAKYNMETPKLKFLQTAHVCNQNKAFLFTIALSTEIKDTSKYEALIKTFKCK